MTRDEIKARHAAWAVEYAAGDSLQMIATRADVSEGAVFSALRRLGVTFRPSGSPCPSRARVRTETFARVVQLCTAGTSSSEAARVVGVSESLARTMVRKAGMLKRRGRVACRHSRLDDMVRDYNAGDSLKTLAARYDIDLSYISRLLRREGVTMRPRGAPRAIDHDAVIAAYATGRKTADVAQEFGISVSAVSHIASAAGVRHYPRPKR